MLEAFEIVDSYDPFFGDIHHVQKYGDEIHLCYKNGVSAVIMPEEVFNQIVEYSNMTEPLKAAGMEEYAPQEKKTEES